MGFRSTAADAVLIWKASTVGQPQVDGVDAANTHCTQSILICDSLQDAATHTKTHQKKKASDVAIRCSRLAPSPGYLPNLSM
jgi:hypothetical protein